MVVGVENTQCDHLQNSKLDYRKKSREGSGEKIFLLILNFWEFLSFDSV